MNRLILATAALTGLALPAAAQRLDTRVREVTTTESGVTCVGNANRGLMISHDADGGNKRALLFQRPDEPDPEAEVTLGFRLAPRKGTVFGAGANVVGLQLVPKKPSLAHPVASARLLLGGEDSGVGLRIQSNPARPGAVYVSVPEEVRYETADRILRAGEIEFELRDGRGAVTKHYVFNANRISDTVEVAAIIGFSCKGGRAD